MTISTSDIPTIYVGFDPREKTPYKVLKYSALKYASAPINIYPIKQKIMRRIGFYRRAWQLGSSSLPKALWSPNRSAVVVLVLQRSPVWGISFF